MVLPLTPLLPSSPIGPRVHAPPRGSRFARLHMVLDAYQGMNGQVQFLSRGAPFFLLQQCAGKKILSLALYDMLAHSPLLPTAYWNGRSIASLTAGDVSRVLELAERWASQYCYLSLSIASHSAAVSLLFLSSACVILLGPSS